MKKNRFISIRWRLLFAFSTVLTLLVGFAVMSIMLQIKAAERAALLEAEDVALAIADTGIENPIDNPAFLQEHVESIERLYQRDLFIVDVNRRVVADTNLEELGSIFSMNPTNEIDRTMRDGQTRTFIEEELFGAKAAKQVVVPLRTSSFDIHSAIVGAVIFEYTSTYNYLMAEAWGAIFWMGGVGILFVIVITGLGLRIAASISQPLAELERGVNIIATDDYSARVEVRSKNEIGALATAFNRMAGDLNISHTKLLERGRQLEEQANELSNANTLLLQAMETQKTSAERIEYLAYHDGLTALPNRSMFSKLLNHGITQARRYNRKLAVLFIDLDRFKDINDTLGHDAGDLLLQEVGQRLKKCLRDSDTVSRLGGDEFVVLLPELDDEKYAVTVAQKVLSAIVKPFSLAGQECRVTPSIGISTYPEHGQDEQSLMKSADIAMYQAKREGRNNYQFYSEELNTNSFERLALESSLRGALERNELQLYYQAKKNFLTDRITGMEALLRWQHPDLGLVEPTQFIPIAEETGLIIPIGRWVLKTACLQNLTWQEVGLPALTMAVNLSARQFADEHLLRDISVILEETGLHPSLLELEITETMIMRDVGKTVGILTALKALGVRIAIDDFGTGYSSLSSLKQFPLDTLKIDGSFVRDLSSNAEDRGIAEAIIMMSKTLNLHVVAECVETIGQADFLRDHACDEFQGFLFSKAVPADEFADLLRAQDEAGVR